MLPLTSAAVLLGFGAATVVWLRRGQSREGDGVWRSLPWPPSEDRFRTEMIADLPEPARRYLHHAIQPGTPLDRSVRLTMSGSIRMSPHGDLLRMDSEELLAGTALFLPSMLLPAPGARWRVVDASTAVVRLETDGEETDITLEMDREGRLQRMTVRRWNADPEVGPVGYLPFVRENFEDERTFGGYTLPTRFRAGGGWARTPNSSSSSPSSTTRNIPEAPTAFVRSRRPRAERMKSRR